MRQRIIFQILDNRYEIKYHSSMKKDSEGKYSDTTVKLESLVVREVSELLEGKQTLTAFVREAVERDVRRRKMRKAAALYREVLAADPAEAKEMDAWEAAPLSAAVPRRPRRS